MMEQTNQLTPNQSSLIAQRNLFLVSEQTYLVSNQLRAKVGGDVSYHQSGRYYQEPAGQNSNMLTSHSYYHDYQQFYHHQQHQNYPNHMIESNNNHRTTSATRSQTIFTNNLQQGPSSIDQERVNSCFSQKEVVDDTNQNSSNARCFMANNHQSGQFVDCYHQHGLYYEDQQDNRMVIIENLHNHQRTPSSHELAGHDYNHHQNSSTSSMTAYNNDCRHIVSYNNCHTPQSDNLGVDGYQLINNNQPIQPVCNQIQANAGCQMQSGFSSCSTLSHQEPHTFAGEYQRNHYNETNNNQQSSHNYQVNNLYENKNNYCVKVQSENPAQNQYNNNIHNAHYQTQASETRGQHQHSAETTLWTKTNSWDNNETVHVSSTSLASESLSSLPKSDDGEAGLHDKRNQNLITNYRLSLSPSRLVGDGGLAVGPDHDASGYDDHRKSYSEISTSSLLSNNTTNMTQDSIVANSLSGEHLDQLAPASRSPRIYNNERHQQNEQQAKVNKCSICGRNYARPSTLKTHLRTHTNERPFKCEVCKKTFSQAANLTAHQRVHTGERPFSCPLCGRQFSQSSSVITHLRTHSGERPYRCNICNRTFSDSSTLTKHCRIHSGEKPYQCNYCPLNFSQSGNLSRHLKLHFVTSSNDHHNNLHLEQSRHHEQEK